MRQKLILIDGSSMLSTSFFGNLPREYFKAKTEDERQEVLKKVLKTKDGQYVNGVFTMMKVFNNLIKKVKPTHLAICWDISRQTFRREMYSEYKAQREETKPELKSQFKLAQEVFKAMNVPQYAVDNYEADDLIGTLAKAFREDMPVYILTKDQDQLQLIDEFVRVWLVTSTAQDKYASLGINPKELDIPDGVFEFTPIYMKEFYGVEPMQIVDRKAIEGDVSDNIPGIKGVGEKAVIPLIQEFGSLEGIYEYIENNEEKDIKEMFKMLGIARSPLSYLTKTSDTELVGKESAFLSKKLATIDINVQALKDVKIEDLTLCIDEVGKVEKFKELEFISLINN